MTRTPCLGLLALFFVCGCSSGDTKPTPDTREQTPELDWVGTFLVDLLAEEPALGSSARTNVQGHVYDREPPPTGVLLQHQSSSGSCELWVPAHPFCEPACGIDAVCTHDGECTPHATPLNAGTVQVTGLAPADFEIDPLSPRFPYQLPAAVHPSYPPCEEGAAVRVIASSFSLEARCVAPLVATGAAPILVESGKPLSLAWTAPADPAASRIAVHIDLAHHGGKKGEINCDAPDTGAFDVPEPLITELIGLGLAGYPTVELTRHSTSASPQAPGIVLRVASTVSRALDTGVTSCSDTEPCPGELRCEMDRTCH
ncbi:MAG: hypothetical protein M3020_20005 [Myxococcota bacterium]|nr:hypothetical protein [Myxococcota bacterium]